MSDWIGQPETTRKFKKDKEGRVVVRGRSPTWSSPMPPRVIAIVGGGSPHAYVWIGDEVCYTHLRLSTLKRLIVSAERKD